MSRSYSTYSVFGINKLKSSARWSLLSNSSPHAVVKQDVKSTTVQTATVGVEHVCVHIVGSVMV